MTAILFVQRTRVAGCFCVTIFWRVATGLSYDRNIVCAEEESHRRFSRDVFVGAMRRGGGMTATLFGQRKRATGGFRVTFFLARGDELKVWPQHCLGRGRGLQEIFA